MNEIPGAGLGIGMMLLLVPGIIAVTILAAAVPAAVIERPGVARALGRSAELTRGSRWSVFGVIFSIYILSYLAGAAVGFLAPLSVNLYLAGSLLTNVVFTALQATAHTLVYFHLRRAKETFDVEEIAAVFD